MAGALLARRLSPSRPDPPSVIPATAGIHEHKLLRKDSCPGVHGAWIKPGMTPRSVARSLEKAMFVLCSDHAMIDLPSDPQRSRPAAELRAGCPDLRIGKFPLAGRGSFFAFREAETSKLRNFRTFRRTLQALRPGAPASPCSAFAGEDRPCGSDALHRAACPRPARSGLRPRRPRRSRFASRPA